MRFTYLFLFCAALPAMAVDVPVEYGVLPNYGSTLPTILEPGKPQASVGFAPQPVIEPEEDVPFTPNTQVAATTFDLTPVAPQTPEKQRADYFLQKLEDATHQMEALTRKVEMLEHEIHILKTTPTAPVTHGDDGSNAEPEDSIETPTPLTADELYDKGRSLITQKQYADARDAFQRLVQEHPDHSLVGSAYYWIGETYFVEGNYEAASKTFGEGFQKNTTHHKAPDHLLKLGMSLSHMGQKDKACITFKKLLKDFPKSSEAILSVAHREMEKLQCPA